VKAKGRASAVFVMFAAIIISSVELKLNYGKCCCCCCRCVSFLDGTRWLGTSKTAREESMSRGCSTHFFSTFSLQLLEERVRVCSSSSHRDDMQGCFGVEMITISRMVTSQMDVWKKT
jgi:hypothetical protein